MANLDNIKYSGKTFIKELIWKFLSKHTPSDKKNICLFASRRSGSTLLMEVLASNKGVSFSDQPFGLYTINSKNLNLLPLFEYGQVISMDSEEERMIHDYLSGLFNGSIHTNAPWKFWKYGGIISSDRLVLKITDAKAIIDWIDKNFSVKTVVMTRHPIPQSLSVIKNEWALTGKAYLRNPYFVKEYLSQEQLSFSCNIYNSGSKLEKSVTDWVLENIIPLRLFSLNPHWIFITYEDLVMYPERSVKSLQIALELTDYSKMLSMLRLPSRSTKNLSLSLTKEKIKAGDKVHILRRWEKEVSRQDKKLIANILDIYKIALYSPYDYLPKRNSIFTDSFKDTIPK